MDYLRLTLLMCTAASFASNFEPTLSFMMRRRKICPIDVSTRREYVAIKKGKTGDICNTASCISLSSSSSRSCDIAETALAYGVSRLSTLQTLLSLHGAPGSVGCNKGGGDVLPASSSFCENLHPSLIPISKSQSTGRYICALREMSHDGNVGEGRNYEDVSKKFISRNPLPIVESGENLPGMRLLSLNSEHLMRRIAAETDGEENGKTIISVYNEALGAGVIHDKELDAPYEMGSVEKLGYGQEKYILLRVGPFPDLYEAMSHRHLSKGDETSALIAAEIANKKFSGFGSTFAMYAGLLSRLPDRAAESRDAARVCLRLSLSTAGMTTEDFVSIARLAELAEESDTPVEAMTKLHLMYEKIRVLAQSDDQARSGKSIHQLAIEKASYLLDTVALKGSRWGEIRQDLGNIFEQAGRPNIAEFVDPSRCT